MRYKYYRKNMVVLVWTGAAHMPIVSKSAHKRIPYNKCANFIKIGRDLADLAKTCFGVKTENGHAYAWPTVNNKLSFWNA